MPERKNNWIENLGNVIANMLATVTSLTMLTTTVILQLPLLIVSVTVFPLVGLVTQLLVELLQTTGEYDGVKGVVKYIVKFKKSFASARRRFLYSYRETSRVFREQFK